MDIYEKLVAMQRRSCTYGEDSDLLAAIAALRAVLEMCDDYDLVETEDVLRAIEGALP